PQAAITTDAECEAALCRVLTGVPVSFRDTSAGSVRARRWDFGDGRQSRSGSVNHAWSAPGFYEVTLGTSDGTVESTASLTFLVEASDPAGTCAPDEWTRCLQDSRYAVTVDWWTADGAGDRGEVVHRGTNDSGMFRFFDPDNWEVLIKVLDGCALNGRVWVFGASTTNLGYLIRVTDTATGAVKEYRNEPGVAAPAITDSQAFPACAR
ncbi:MAG: PKD domain-containing protein, partial [Holophagales bacterium]|nr:PKD domain-containing protein [Holophagales bacterium]